MTSSIPDLPETANSHGEWKVLSEINLPRQRNADKLAVELVSHIIEDLHLPAGRMEQLKQAIAAATSNAMNLKNLGAAELPVSIRVLVAPQIIELHEAEHREMSMEMIGAAADPKDASIYKDFPHGWGFFLIDRTLASQAISSEGARQRIELFIYMEGGRKKPLSR